MDYDFGDIFDAREAPGIGHFIVIVGENTKQDKTEVMYYVVTSRVYAVFTNILAYFNECLQSKDKRFLKHFSKEKGKPRISPHGKLAQAIFLDKETNYDSCLDVDSMVVVNRDPQKSDKTALAKLREDKLVVCKGKLHKIDALHLREVIKNSDDVSSFIRDKILAAFNKSNSTLK